MVKGERILDTTGVCALFQLSLDALPLSLFCLLQQMQAHLHELLQNPWNTFTELRKRLALTKMFLLLRFQRDQMQSLQPT